MSSAAVAELRVPADPAAGARLAVFFGKHSRMVYGLCRLLLRDEHEAEDAAQQTFLSAHRSLLRGNEPREPSAWLAAIARNECRARIRARMTAPLVLVADQAAAGNEVEGAVARRDEIEAICTALGDLPERQRDALVLREFYGLSQDEIASALGISASAVESLLVRGRRAVKESLRPDGVGVAGLAVPASLRDALAQAVPGFSSAAATGPSVVVGSVAVLAKTSAAPLASKVAAVALAVSAAVGTPGSERMPALPSTGGTRSAPVVAVVQVAATASHAKKDGGAGLGAPRPDGARSAPEAVPAGSNEDASPGEREPVPFPGDVLPEAETPTADEGGAEQTPDESAPPKPDPAVEEPVEPEPEPPPGDNDPGREVEELPADFAPEPEPSPDNRAVDEQERPSADDPAKAEAADVATDAAVDVSR